MSKLTIEELASFCKKKGFVFQAGEIYGGLAGFFDFGPLGVELKNNIKREYWKKFVHKREDIFGQDGSIITNPKVWKASGHVETFGDMLLTTKDTKTKLRADHFIEDELKIPGDTLTPKEIEELIVKNNLKFKGEDFELPIQFFSGMLQTQIGADITKQNTAYLRPETAQSIFPNFRIIADVSRGTLPFGITQIGKAYRNEISPRDFIFRCREFEQIEMEYFFNPQTKSELLTNDLKKVKFQFLDAKTQDEGKIDMVEMTIGDLLKDETKNFNSHHAYWFAVFFKWFNVELGLDYKNLRVREHVSTELSHYSSATFDIDYNFSMGFKEMFGMANRTDYDLKAHAKDSKTKMEFHDEKTQSKVIPHVIEPTIGVERLMMALIYDSYTDDKERGNIVLNMNPKLVPNQVAIFPLMNKDELTTLARKIHEELLDEGITSFYDKSGSIGKRYARQDEVGTPYCLTIDYEAIEEGDKKDTVTIRDRNSTEQKRININEITETISKLIKGKINFEDIK
jgi:glycyl-tRNA synthetase